jgi:hypothetical protein
MFKSNLSSLSWVAQTYYYIVIISTMIAFSFGLFSFSKAVLVRFVFTEISLVPGAYFGGGNNDYAYQNCLNTEVSKSSTYTQLTPLSPSDVGSNPNTASEETKQKCKAQTDKEKIRQESYYFSDTILSSTLSMIISILILVGNYVWFTRIAKNK